MNGMPCKNLSCQSCGQPHPNCRCYGFAGGGSVPSFDELQDDSQTSQKPLMFDDLHDDSAGKSLADFDSLKDDNEKYGSVGQQAIAGLEGAAQGFAGPLATLAETKLLGVKPEDIKGRAAANPWTHGIAEAGTFGASMLYGVGEAGLIAKGAEAVTGAAKIAKLSQATMLAKAGSSALNLFLQGASYKGADEITKSLLHQPGVDPEETVGTALAHMGANGLITAAGGGLFNIVGKGLSELGGQAMEQAARKAMIKLANNKPATRALELGIGAVMGEQAHAGIVKDILTGGATYEVLKKWMEPYLEGIIGRPLAKANQYASDAIINALSKENFISLPTAMRWGQYVGKGAIKMLPAIEALFQGTSKQLIDEPTDEMLEELSGNVEKGTPQTDIQDSLHGDQTQNFAKGGPVSQGNSHANDHFGSLYPEQNVLLNAAKARVYGYLNSIRPLPTGTLPFDNAPVNTDKKKAYHRALSLAVTPLTILNHVQKGTLTSEQMQHFTQMYPEVYRVLSKKMTERITKAQLNGEKPDFQKRQSMSLFLGSALDSSLAPQMLQTAQMTFMQKSQRQQAQQGQTPQAKNKRKTSGLDKSSQGFLTDDQAREKRQQAAKP